MVKKNLLAAFILLALVPANVSLVATANTETKVFYLNHVLAAELKC